MADSLFTVNFQNSAHLSVAWRMSEANQPKSEGLPTWGDHFSTELPGYNLNLEMDYQLLDIEPNEAEKYWPKIVAESKSILAPFDHSVLNEVVLGAESSDSGLDPFDLLGEIFERLNSESTNEFGFYMQKLILTVTKNLVVEYSESSKSYRWAFPIRSAIGKRPVDVLCWLEVGEKGTWQLGVLEELTSDFQEKLKTQDVASVLNLSDLQELPFAAFTLFAKQVSGLVGVQISDAFLSQNLTYRS